MEHRGFGGAARRLGRTARRSGPLLAIVLSVAGCNQAVDTWRSLNGTDINDPNPKTTPFTGNMAGAYRQPYPNLATVPPPPTDETSTAERRQLTQHLIADRAAAAAAGVQPAGAEGMPGLASAASHATRPAGNSRGSTPGSEGAAARQPGEPPAPQPLNTDLVMPAITAPLPQPQAPRLAPPNPRLAALPAAPPSAPLTPPAAVSAMPQPAPPQPVLTLAAPPPAAKPTPKPRPATATVATLGLDASATMDATARARLAQVAAMYKEKPGNVRVVAFAAAPPPGADPLALYHAALDRAQGIARALAAYGIPSGKIQTEATPASGAQLGRIEIQFVP